MKLPILDGTVTPDGIDLVPSIQHPSEMFWRQLCYAEFDVSEMSIPSIMAGWSSAKSLKNTPDWFIARKRAKGNVNFYRVSAEQWQQG